MERKLEDKTPHSELAAHKPEIQQCKLSPSLHSTLESSARAGWRIIPGTYKRRLTACRVFALFSEAKQTKLSRTGLMIALLQAVGLILAQIAGKFHKRLWGT